MNRRDFIKLCLLCASIPAISGCSGNSIVKETNNQNPKKLKHVEIHLVEHCNLNCKYCSHFSCIADEEYYDLDEYERDIARLAQLTGNNLACIQLLGGEPLLHPDITTIFDITRKYYPELSLDILTNGILLDSMPEKFWKSLNKNNVNLVPSLYPINLNWQSIFEKVNKYDVYMRLDGDKERLTMDMIERRKIRAFSKLSIDLQGKQKINRYCGLREWCANLIKGKLYPCFVSANIKHFNKKFKKHIPVTKKDYIDIYKAKSIDDLISFVSSPTPFCKYCLGYRQWNKWENSNEHHIDEWAI